MDDELAIDGTEDFNVEMCLYMQSDMEKMCLSLRSDTLEYIIVIQLVMCYNFTVVNSDKSEFEEGFVK